MSIALATKGMISTVGIGGGGGLVYVPIGDAEVGTERIGSKSMSSKELDPDLRIVELKPKIKAYANTE